MRLGHLLIAVLFCLGCQQRVRPDSSPATRKAVGQGVVGLSLAGFPTTPGCCSAASTGSATAANQATEIASLASINGKTPALVGGAVPVNITGSVVASSDVSDRPGRLLGITYGSQGQQLKQTPTNYNAAVELYAGGSAYDGRLIRALTSADVVTIVPSGTQTVTGPLTDTQLRASAVPVSMATPPTGGSTAALQTAGNASLTSIDGKTATLVSGRVPVDPSGVTSPVSAVSLPLPTGAATSGKQDTGNTSLASVDTKTPALGQTTMAGSVPVAIASNQTPVPISGTVTSTPSGTQAVSSAASSFVDGHDLTLGATTDASTATTVIGRLQKLVALLGGGFPSALGQTTKAASLGVALASDQVGTAGSAASNVMSVQGVASMTPVTVTTNGSSFALLNSAATTTISSSSATLRSVCVTTSGALGDTLKVYNANGAATNQIADLDYKTIQCVAFGQLGVAAGNGITTVTTGTLGRAVVVYN